MRFSLYIHIPFCTAKCRYCDFFSITTDNTGAEECYRLQKDLLSGILNELRIRLDEYSPEQINTVFIGGGTPSSIDPLLLDAFFTELECLLKNLINDDTEFSIEANPETCGDEFLSVLAIHRVNRLSIGVQSFDKKTLVTIGRASFPDDIYDTVSKIRDSWKKKLSLDIITGVSKSYIEDLHQALRLSPEHLSVYALTFEEGTPLYDDLIKGKITPPDDELQAEAITEASLYLEKHGYYRYEVSNYAKSSTGGLNECMHNLAYWNMQCYIGVGPAAVSSFYLNGENTRVTNTEDVGKYISTFTNKQIEIEDCRNIEVLSKFDFILEHFLMGGRLKAGIDAEAFKERFGGFPESFIPQTISRWASAGLTGAGPCALNDEGMLLLNRFISETYDELKKNKNI